MTQPVVNATTARAAIVNVSDKQWWLLQQHSVVIATIARVAIRVRMGQAMCKSPPSSLGGGEHAFMT